MKTFYNESTKHYVASRIAFTKGIVKAPTLLIFSDADSLSTPRVNEIVQRELSEINVEVSLALTCTCKKNLSAIDLHSLITTISSKKLYKKLKWVYLILLFSAT